MAVDGGARVVLVRVIDESLDATQSFTLTSTDPFSN